MGKKKKKTTVKPVYEREIRGAANTVTNAFNSSFPQIQALTNETVGLLNPELSRRFTEGDPGVNAARDYGVAVLNGDYLDEGNPYLEDVIAQTNRDVADSVNAQLSLRGLTGSSNRADILARALAENTTNLRYGDYARERAAQDAAAARSAGIAAADYLPVAGLIETLNAAQTPLRAASGYGATIGGILGPYTNTTQKTSGGFLSGLLGSALSGWASGGFR